MKNFCIYFIFFFSILSFSAKSQTGEPFATLVEIIHACGNSLGAATFELNGNPASYNYYWMHGPTTLHIENLTPGTYTLVVINEFGCKQEFVVEILSFEGCNWTSEVVLRSPCEAKITIEVFLMPGMIPVNENALQIVWADGHPPALTRIVPRDHTADYCVTITLPGAGGQNCCEIHECFHIVANPKCKMPPLRVIVNEINRSQDGSGQYVELLVIGNGECSDSIDLRGFHVDDNNGLLIPANDFVTNLNLASIGINPGFISFNENPVWSAVSTGSLIVIRSDGHANFPANMPADDPTDADHNGVYIVAADNNDYFTARSGTWNNNEKQAAYNGYLVPLSWSLIEISSAADGMQVRNPDGTYCHGISLGETAFSATNNFPLWITNSNAGNKTCMLTGIDYTSKTAFQCVPSDEGLQSPGMANSNDNAALISTLKDCTDERSSAKGTIAVNASTVNNKLTVFPNPFSGEINIKLESIASGNTHAVIYAVTGSILLEHSWACEEGESTANLRVQDSLPPGMLLLQITFPSGEKKTVRVVKIPSY